VIATPLQNSGPLALSHPSAGRLRISKLCTKLVYNDAMPVTKHVRRSVSLPVSIAKQVDRLARSQRLSDNRVLVELIELGIEARKQKEKEFFELAERFRAASDPEQAKRLGNELGLLVFKNLMGKNAGKLKFSDLPK
jgi:hypothetical protein